MSPPTQAPPPPANTPNIIIGMPGHPPPQPLLAVEPIENLSSSSRGFVVLTLLNPIRNVNRLAALRLPILATVEAVHRLQQQLSAASDAQLELIAECVGRFYRRGCVLINIGNDNRRTAQRPHGQRAWQNRDLDWHARSSATAALTGRRTYRGSHGICCVCLDAGNAWVEETIRTGSNDSSNQSMIQIFSPASGWGS